MVDKLGLDDDKHHCNLKQAFKDFLNNSSFPCLNLPLAAKVIPKYL